MQILRHCDFVLLLLNLDKEINLVRNYSVFCFEFEKEYIGMIF